MKISIIIPTLNRYKDLKIALDSILLQSILPDEVLIVDQSDNFEKIDTDKYNFVKQFKFSIKSGALARNFWIENLDKESDIVIFLDDDVYLDKKFIENIINFFWKNEKALWWVANIFSKNRTIWLLKKVWFFLLTWGFKFSETFVTRGWFNIMPLSQPTTLKNVERTSWCGMFFRKNIFDEDFRFEERFLKYSLMEDCFLSYSIQLKYPKSLFFLPEVKMVHYESPISRIPNKAKIYQNIVHRFYFVKNFKKSVLIYLRTMFIFCVFDLINFKTLKVVLRYIKWINYALSNRQNILQPDFDFNTFIFS